MKNWSSSKIEEKAWNRYFSHSKKQSLSPPTLEEIQEFDTPPAINNCLLDTPSNSIPEPDMFDRFLVLDEYEKNAEGDAGQGFGADC